MRVVLIEPFRLKVAKQVVEDFCFQFIHRYGIFDQKTKDEHKPIKTISDIPSAFFSPVRCRRTDTGGAGRAR